MKLTQQNIKAEWVTGSQYAAIHHLSEQTLATWRRQDKLAGRDGAAPGFPRYKRFGRAIRYRLEPE